MIHIHKDYKGDSFFKNEALFDSTRSKEYRVKIFGMTIFKRTESFDLNIVKIENVQNNGGSGFKIGEKK
jgi:hypothetical protein